ncbi:MAG: VCBS repeat-containing protein, partial [Elusimicrobia bacterium]|nr:VCBS repeat-containing protein [Elusimicrobiota bacterium]
GEGPHWDVVSEDFNGDSVMDLAVANYGTPSNPGRYVFILRGNGDGTFQRAGNVEVGRGPSAIAVGDFRGDDHVDLAVANVVSNDLSILLDNGDGTFQSARNYQVGGNPTRLAIGDFTGDGIQDIAAAYNEANVSVLIGNGDGTFQPAQDAVRRKGLITPADLCVGDFNHDGLQDLAIANGSHNTIAVLLSTGDGTFQTPQFFAVGAYPGSITTGDFNGDGLQDIAVTNEFSDTISVLTNTTPDKGN